MKLLVNYSSSDKNYIASLAYLIKGAGHTALSTNKDLTIAELISLAEQSSCKAIILCNAQTLRYCVPGESPTLDKWRGSVLRGKIPIIIINTLAHIHTVPHGKWLMEKDLAKVALLNQPVPSFSYKVLLDQSEFSRVLRRMGESILTAHDIETRTPKLSKLEEAQRDNGVPTEVGFTRITCASWSCLFDDGTIETFVLPLIDYDGDHWKTQKEYEEAILFLKRANAIAIDKVMHNGMYDTTHLMIYHAPPMQWTLDTMALAHAAYAELPKSLDFVASYTCADYIQWKTDATEAAAKQDITIYWKYNAQDTWWTLRVAIAQLRNMPAYARKNYSEKFPLVYPALYGNFEGCLIDQGVRSKARAESLTQLDRARDLLCTMFADPSFNPGSWQQVSKYLYTVFGAKNPKIGKSKSGTDEKNLNAVAEQHPLLARLTKEILDYREAQKAIGTYYDFLQKNGRLLWATNPFGTETERMACNGSSLWCGTQVQNIPSYAKAMLVADDGFELVEVDNSQSEARCVAYCAKEYALAAALEDAERDFYKTLGTLFFGIPYEQVTQFFRNSVLKKIVHGTNYLMGADTFIVNTGVKVLFEAAEKLNIQIVEIPRKNNENQKTLKQFAKLLLDSYHKPFKRIKEWYKELYNEVDTTGMLVSPLGHVRVFFGDISKSHGMLRSVVAHQPQNLSVTVLNKGFKRAYKDMVLPSGGEFRLKAQIHDSVWAQYPKAKRDIYIPKLLECMTNPVEVHGRILRIPLEAKYGPSWADMRKYECHN